MSLSDMQASMLVDCDVQASMFTIYEVQASMLIDCDMQASMLVDCDTSISKRPREAAASALEAATCAIRFT